MDEISLFTALRPDPLADADDADDAQTAIRDRLAAAIDGSAASAPARRQAWSRTRLITAGGLVAAGAAAAIVVPAVLPDGAHGTFVTKAWAVEREPNGTVSFSVGKLFNDPHGLQHALRAAGVNAFVQLLSIKITGDQAYQSCEYADLDREPQSVQQAVIAAGTRDESWTVRSAAMPSGASLLIALWPSAAVSATLNPVVLATSKPPACVPTPPPPN